MTAEVRCKACGGVLYEIMYGMPSYDFVQEIEAGAPYVIGGCVIDLDAPTHQCHECGLEVALEVEDEDEDD